MADLSDRVALFLTGLAGGGAERVMLSLAMAFADEGLDVDLVVTKARGPLVSEIPNNVNLVDLGSNRILTSLPAMVAYLRRRRPRVMLSALPSTNCLAIWARALSNVPLRLYISEHSATSVATSASSDLRLKVLPKLMAWSYPKADGLIAVSEGVASDVAYLTGVDKQKINVIHNPIVSKYFERKCHSSANHEFFGTRDIPVIISAGRFVPAKDFSTLIRAFGGVIKVRDARLIILGEGPQRPELELLAQDLGLGEKISMPGYVPNPYPYFRKSDLFVMSSRWEGFGNVIVEALACNTPVVATDCPNGPSEILENGAWGRLISVGSPEEMADAIVEALEKAKVDVISRAYDFTVEKAATKYLELMCLDRGEFLG